MNPEIIYKVYDRSSIYKKIAAEADRQKLLTELNTQAYSEKEFARVLSRFTELITSLNETGSSSILKKIGLSDLHEKEDLELLAVHPASTRIESAALKHYLYLLDRGMGRYLAQSYAVRLVIDQICYGQYRDKKLRDNTAYSLINLIARSFRLFADNAKYNTRLITENLFQN